MDYRVSHKLQMILKFIFFLLLGFIYCICESYCKRGINIWIAKNTNCFHNFLFGRHRIRIIIKKKKLNRTSLFFDACIPFLVLWNFNDSQRSSFVKIFIIPKFSKFLLLMITWYGLLLFSGNVCLNSVWNLWHKMHTKISTTVT